MVIETDYTLIIFSYNYSYKSKTGLTNKGNQLTLCPLFVFCSGLQLDMFFCCLIKNFVTIRVHRDPYQNNLQDLFKTFQGLACCYLHYRIFVCLPLSVL